MSCSAPALLSFITQQSRSANSCAPSSAMASEWVLRFGSTAAVMTPSRGRCCSHGFGRWQSDEAPLPSSNGAASVCCDCHWCSSGPPSSVWLGHAVVPWIRSVACSMTLRPRLRRRRLGARLRFGDRLGSAATEGVHADAAHSRSEGNASAAGSAAHGHPLKGLGGGSSWCQLIPRGETSRCHSRC
jgi:hypothetical protein